MFTKVINDNATNDTGHASNCYYLTMCITITHTHLPISFPYNYLLIFPILFFSLKSSSLKSSSVWPVLTLKITYFITSHCIITLTAIKCLYVNKICVFLSVTWNSICCSKNEISASVDYSGVLYCWLTAKFDKAWMAAIIHPVFVMCIRR